MSSLDFDFDMRMIQLETEWRAAFEESIKARAEYQTLASTKGVKAELLDKARERLDRHEAWKDRIMAKIERLENALLSASLCSI